MVGRPPVPANGISSSVRSRTLYFRSIEFHVLYYVCDLCNDLSCSLSSSCRCSPTAALSFERGLLCPGGAGTPSVGPHCGRLSGDLEWTDQRRPKTALSPEKAAFPTFTGHMAAKPRATVVPK